MTILCTEKHLSLLVDYLSEEAVYNTFMLADIENYGFDQEFQQVYGDFRGELCQGVYLRFYENLIIYSKSNDIDFEFLKILTENWKPAVVMGKAENVLAVQTILNNYKYEDKHLYLLNSDEQLISDIEGVKKGIPGDEDKIHEFLMGIEEIKALYTSKEMIRDRLVSGDGVHYYLESEDTLSPNRLGLEECQHVTAHINSTAISQYTVMIGGLAVNPNLRKQGIASAMVSKLCREILAQNKKPSLFSSQGETDNLYLPLGFEPAGMWGTLIKPPADEKETVKLPSYIPVYNQLYHDIVFGVYEKGSLLPGENSLAAKYQVSRNTLRQALTILCQDGYIYKQQGKGTFVSRDKPGKPRKKIHNFLIECAVDEITRIVPDYNFGLPTEIAKNKLQLKEGEEILASNNVYFSEDQAVGQAFIQIPIKYLSEDKVELTSSEELLRFMNEIIYEKAVTADLSMRVAEADEQVVPYMKIPEGTVLLNMEQILYGIDRVPTARIKYYFMPQKYQVYCQL